MKTPKSNIFKSDNGIAWARLPEKGKTKPVTVAKPAPLTPKRECDVMPGSAREDGNFVSVTGEELNLMHDLEKAFPMITDEDTGGFENPADSAAAQGIFNNDFADFLDGKDGR